MNVSPDNSGSVRVDGSAATSYPAVIAVTSLTVILEARPAAGYTFANWSGAVTAAVNPTYLYMDCDKTLTATFVPDTPESLKLYFPHVASQGPPDAWETEVCVINTSAQSLTGTLKSYRNNGQPVSSDKTITLAAHGRWSRIVGAGDFTNPSEIGYMVFESTSDNVVGYTKFFKEGRYRTAVPAVRDVNTADIHVPHIASDAEWWTGISLVNTTAATKVLTISFNNGETRQVTLTGGEHKAFDIASLFNNQPHADIRSATITNASGIIGLELFGASNQLDGIPLTDKTASTLYFPHVAAGEWWTGIVAYNPSELPSPITITPYSAQGTPLATSTPSPIAGKEKYVGAVSDLALPAQIAWFKIDSPQPLSGFELFGTIDGNQLAPYAGRGGAGAKTGVFAKIERNGWTGITFVNTEADAASVTLTAYNDSGDVVATSMLSVGGYAKVVNLAGAIFAQDISSASYLAYSSDKNVVGFQLNGTADWTLLDGLPAL